MPGAAVERYAPMSDHDGGAQSEDLPVLCRGHLDVLDMVAAVRRRLVVLAARLRPLHGPFSFIAQKTVMKSPGYCGILLPKPPPTSGAMTRSLSSGTPVTTEQRKRTMCGFCVVFQSVSSPVRRTTARGRRAVPSRSE